MRSELIVFFNLQFNPSKKKLRNNDGHMSKIFSQSLETYYCRCSTTFMHSKRYDMVVG